MANKNPYTDKYKSDYQKERKRVTALVKRYKEKGFFFEQEIIPPKPKRITKASVDRLKKINADYLKDKATYFITPEGEAVSPYSYKKYQQAKQPSEAQKFASLRNIAKAHAKSAALKHRKNETFSSDPDIAKFQKAQSDLEVARGLNSLYLSRSLYETWKRLKAKEGIDVANRFAGSLSEREYYYLESAYLGESFDKKPDKNSVDYRIQKASEFVKLYNKLKREDNDREAKIILDKLSPEDREDVEDFLRYRPLKERRIPNEEAGRTEESDKRKTSEDVVSDEGSKSQPSGNENYSFDGADGYGSGYADDDDEDDEESEDESDEDFEQFKARKEAERDRGESFREQIDKDYEGEKFKKWREELENQLKKKKSERDFVYEGDQAYNVLVNQIKQFEKAFESGDASFRFVHQGNAKLMGSLLGLLEDQIARYGKDAVLGRLSGRALEINNLVETMSYKYEEDASNAFAQLAFIIKGESLSAKESEYLYDAGERYASSFLYFEDEEE